MICYLLLAWFLVVLFGVVVFLPLVALKLVQECVVEEGFVDAFGFPGVGCAGAGHRRGHGSTGGLGEKFGHGQPTIDKKKHVKRARLAVSICIVGKALVSDGTRTSKPPGTVVPHRGSNS